jgi:hypothetical protein
MHANLAQAANQARIDDLYRYAEAHRVRVGTDQVEHPAPARHRSFPPVLKLRLPALAGHGR